MLYREVIAVCSEIHTKIHKYIVWAERRFTHKYIVWAERRFVECYTGGTYSNH